MTSSRPAALAAAFALALAAPQAQAQATGFAQSDPQRQPFLSDGGGARPNFDGPAAETPLGPPPIRRPDGLRGLEGDRIDSAGEFEADGRAVRAPGLGAVIQLRSD